MFQKSLLERKQNELFHNFILLVVNIPIIILHSEVRQPLLLELLKGGADILNVTSITSSAHVFFFLQLFGKLFSFWHFFSSTLKVNLSKLVLIWRKANTVK